MHRCTRSWPGSSLLPARVGQVSANKLKKLPPALTALSTLRVLVCEDNALESLPDPPAGSHYRWGESLELLRLKGNRITRIPDSMCEPVEGHGDGERDGKLGVEGGREDEEENEKQAGAEGDTAKTARRPPRSAFCKLKLLDVCGNLLVTLPETFGQVSFWGG